MTELQTIIKDICELTHTSSERLILLIISLVIYDNKYDIKSFLDGTKRRDRKRKIFKENKMWAQNVGCVLISLFKSLHFYSASEKPI